MTDTTAPLYDGNEGRAQRRLDSKASLWTSEAAERREAIQRMEDKGMPLSPTLTLQAGYADEAKAAHDEKESNR